MPGCKRDDTWRKEDGKHFLKFTVERNSRSLALIAFFHSLLSKATEKKSFHFTARANPSPRGEGRWLGRCGSWPDPLFYPITASRHRLQSRAKVHPYFSVWQCYLCELSLNIFGELYALPSWTTVQLILWYKSFMCRYSGASLVAPW